MKCSGLNEEVKRRAKELEAANKQLSSANEQLKIHDKMQKEFINVASHEIKTPTQAILGYTEILQSILRKDSKFLMLCIEMLTGYKDLQTTF
jgi:signal transduction histidine kinase